MTRFVVSIALLSLLVAACAREGIQTEPEFKDWSYQTRKKDHNRYDGYSDYHIREEQWQTDPYWTMGEGLERRKAARAKAAGQAPVAAPVQQKVEMPPERFMKKPVTTPKAAAQPVLADDPNAR